MARNDFVTLKARVNDELHDSSLSNKVGDFINEWLDDIEIETNHKVLRKSTSFTLTASTQEYSIATNVATNANFIVAVTLRDPDTYLTEVTRQEILQLDPELDDVNSSPFLYWVYGDTLGLYPVPDAADTLYVEYVDFSDDLSADSDTPAFSKQWSSLIVDGAVARGLKYLRPGNPQVWKAQMDDAFGKLRRMVAKQQRKPNLRLKLKSVDEKDFRSITPYIERFKS